MLNPEALSIYMDACQLRLSEQEVMGEIKYKYGKKPLLLDYQRADHVFPDGIYQGSYSVKP